MSRKGLKFLLAGLLVMVAGYILMTGGQSGDPAVFSDDIFDFRRLVASPLLIIMGIVIIIASIMSKPKNGGKEGEE